MTAEPGKRQRTEAEEANKRQRVESEKEAAALPTKGYSTWCVDNEVPWQVRGKLALLFDDGMSHAQGFVCVGVSTGPDDPTPCQIVAPYSKTRRAVLTRLRIQPVVAGGGRVSITVRTEYHPPESKSPAVADDDF